MEQAAVAEHPFNKFSCNPLHYPVNPLRSVLRQKSTCKILSFSTQCAYVRSVQVQFLRLIFRACDNDGLRMWGVYLATLNRCRWHDMFWLLGFSRSSSWSKSPSASRSEKPKQALQFRRTGSSTSRPQQARAAQQQQLSRWRPNPKRKPKLATLRSSRSLCTRPRSVTLHTLLGES